jgi:hypothetical protein
MHSDRWDNRLLGLLLVTFLLTGCQDGIYSGTLIFSDQHQFGATMRLPGDVLLRAGTAEFAAGSHVDGSIYVVGGTLLMDGDVGGDLLVLDGRVTLGPTAVIGGDLRYSEGTVVQADTAVVRGETIAGLPLPLESDPQPAGWDSLLRSLLAALLLATLGGLWVHWRPQPLQQVAMATRNHWLVALSMGLLALLVLPILLVMMAFTIVLLPLVLVLAVLIFLIVGMGIITMGMEVGRWLVARTGRSLAPGWATFWGVLLLMLLFELPGVGNLLLLGVAIFLFGAVLLTRFGTRPYNPPQRPAGDLATYRRQKIEGSG